MLVTCKECGKEFEKTQAEVNRTKTHFCSRECVYKNRSNYEIVKCEQCGKEFKKAAARINITNKNFCSNECKFQYRNEKIELKCDYCGKIHYRSRNQFERADHHYCSRECALKAQNKQIEKVCPNCGNTFLTPPSMAEKRIFCSEKCKFEDIRKRETSSRTYIKCDNCGKKILRNKKRIKENEFNFCSYTCMGLFKRGEEYLDDYYDTHDWKTLRAEAIERDGKKCSICGADDKTLTVHHIVPRKDGGADKLENLITVCNTCHIKQHIKYMTDRGKDIKIRNYYKKLLKTP